MAGGTGILFAGISYKVTNSGTSALDDAIPNTPNPKAHTEDGNMTSANTKVNVSPEVKSTNAIKSSSATVAWDDYLGSNTSNINPRTGLPDANRIFSNDGTKAVRFGNHEMNSIGTTKAHFHYETRTYDPVNDIMNITNKLQRLK